MSKEAVRQPTREEAFASVLDVLYAINQCLACSYWHYSIEPLLPNRDDTEQQHTRLVIRNSLIESTLMFIRKLNEFFGSPEKTKRNDGTLRACHFGDFHDVGWFLTKDEYNEIHLRVAHMSVQEVRNGKKTWQIDDYLRRCLTKSVKFLEFLQSCPEIRDHPQKGDIEMTLKGMRGMLRQGDGTHHVVGEVE